MNKKKKNKKPKFVKKHFLDDDIIIIPYDNDEETDLETTDIETVGAPVHNDVNNDVNHTKPRYENLVLSGGSIRGISHIGALKELVDKGLIDLRNLKALAAVSIGSLIGILIVLGFSIDEIWDFVYHLDMKKIIRPDIFLFIKKCGMDTGYIIYDLIEQILTKKTDIKHITFKQLYEITKIHFTAVGACLTTKDIVYYDHINTPNFKVSMAIRISIGLPGLFTPVVINGKQYIDGGVLNNYPINLFADRLDKTVGILICNECNTKYKYPEEYFIAIMNLFQYNYYQKSVEKYTKNTIYIKECPDNTHILSFNLDNKTKVKLYNIGMTAVKNFCHTV